MGPDPGRLLTVVGMNTAVVGRAVVASPGTAARLLDAEGHGGAIRAAGLVELALAPALVWGRPRWVWAAARTALTLGFAAATATHVRRERSGRTTAAMVGMLVLAGVDGFIAARLKRAG